MAPFTYRSYKQKAPWTVANYDTTPHGGYRVTEEQVAGYLNTLWRYLQDPAARRPKVPRYSRHVQHPDRRAMQALTRAVESSGAASLAVQEEPDGSVEIAAPIVHDPEVYRYLLNAQRFMPAHVGDNFFDAP